MITNSVKIFPRRFGRVVKATDLNSSMIDQLSTSVSLGSAGSNPAGVVFFSVHDLIRSVLIFWAGEIRVYDSGWMDMGVAFTIHC